MLHDRRESVRLGAYVEPRPRENHRHESPSFVLILLVTAIACPHTAADPPPRTTLSDDSIRYTVPEKPYVVLKRADVEAVVVDNCEVDDDVLPGHRAGYSGIGSLKHREAAGEPVRAVLRRVEFRTHPRRNHARSTRCCHEPRCAPMQLRVIDPHTAELYQAPTPHYGLESCLRYQLLEDGTIEMTLECIPRRRSFKNGYIGLFWAGYIHKPESLDIHFKGVRHRRPTLETGMDSRNHAQTRRRYRPI